MTARPLPLGVLEPPDDKVSSSKSNSENSVISINAESYDINASQVQMLQVAADLSSSDMVTDGNASQRMKKSSFQITRIVKSTEAGDSADDIDDVTSTEDVSSSVTEALRNANTKAEAHSHDAVCSSSSAEDVESLSSYQKHLCPHPLHSARQRPCDINSRFKIVKIESNKPLRRGRWMCLEFVDPPQLGVSLDKTAKNDDTGLSSSCIASPIYYVQVEKEDPSNNPFAAAIIYSNGQPSLEPNPLPLRESAMSPSSCSILTESLILSAMKQQLDSGIEVLKQTSCLSSELSDREGESSRSSDRHPLASSYVVSHHQHQQSDSSLDDSRVPLNGFMFSNDGLATVTKEDDHIVIRTGSEPTFGCSKVSDAASTSPLFTIVPTSTNSCSSDFADNEISVGICALDNKIEQAMDLVKSHLMFAVHEEVELLKEQIKELTIKKGQLEYENTVLRASATQETLEKLHGSPSSTGLS